jgi:CheY-like chemotaxis protein
MIAAPATPKACLLLVDDTPANIDLLVAMLGGDYELKVANRGARALQLCAAGGVDLVLLDVMMPEMDGFEVCRRLRADAATRDVPVIFLTARTDVEATVRGFEVGGDDYVAKPFRPEELGARVRTQLALRAQRRELDARNAELKSLLHIVGHDVANQFTVVQMMLDLTRQFPDRPFTEILPHVTAAVRNGIGLTRVVRELRVSEDKPLTLESVAVGPAVAEAVLLAEPRAAEKAVTISQQMPDVLVRAERASFVVSVLGNLLSNAIKFTPAGGQVSVMGAVEGDLVHVTVRDTGIGMDPETVATVFDVVKSASRRGTDGERGTGFGMTLMQRFVVRYGGSVEIVSRPLSEHPDDHGTDVRVILRIATER